MQIQWLLSLLTTLQMQSMWHQVQLVPCHTTYSVQPLTMHIVLKSRNISCITLSHPHSKVHIYLFQLLHSITPNILPLFSDTKNIQPLESSFVWGEPSLACGWSVCASRHRLWMLQLATDHHIQNVLPTPLPSSSPVVDDCFRLWQPCLDADSAE